MDVVKDLQTRMKKAVTALKDELSSLRAGRASTSLLEHIQVEVYGNRMPIHQMATVNVPEARLITIQPWDRGATKAIEKAIRDSDLGLNPISDGAIVRVPLPELTEERRREIVKLVHKYGEQSKVAIRNIRREAMEQAKKLEKSKELSQDDLRHMEKTIQENTDQTIREVELMVTKKETDVMQV